MIELEDFIGYIKDASKNEGNAKISVKDAYSKLKEDCSKNNRQIREQVTFLIKKTVYNYICFDHPIHPQIGFLKFILDATKDVSEDVSHYKQENWVEIIKTIDSAKEESHFFEKDYDSLEYLKKEIAFSLSCKKLLKEGVEFEFKDFDIYIDTNSFAKIRDRILKLSNEVGGEEIIKLSLSLLKEKYDQSMSRYHITRNVSQYNEDIPADTPWGYLMIAGLNSLDKKNTNKKNSQKKFIELVDYLTNLVAVMEVQPYSPWENFFVNDKLLVKFLQECIVYDNLIPLQQWNPTHARLTINSLTKNFIKNNHSSYNNSLKNIVKIGITLIKSASPTTTTVININEISKKTNIPAPKVKLAFDKIFTFTKPANYAESLYPPDANNALHYIKPLLFSSGKYFIMPSSMCSFSVTNAILHQISNPSGVYNNYIDSKLGYEIESLLNDAFASKGIDTTSGEFFFDQNKDTTGESDLIVETSSQIFIFEIKKKSLTNAALFGQDYEILSSLAKSVLHSQIQAMKIEYLLRLNGEIEIKGKTKTKTIKLNNRQINRVSVSLNDFGSLQDIITLQSTLKSCVASVITSTVKSVDKTLSKWREYVKEINNYAVLIEQLQTTPQPYFFNSTFMSISQILTLLNDCKNAEDFLNEISRGSRTILSKRDFYLEYKIKKNMFQ